MSDYRPPVKDLKYALEHFGRLEELTAHERYGHVDPETLEAVIDEHSRFMAEVWAPTDRDGDTEGLTWTPEGVTTPESFKPAWDKFVEGGWQGFNLEPEYGGMGFPASVFSVGSEVSSGSNAAFAMLPGLTTGACELLEAWGTEEQKEVYLTKMVRGQWSGTMNLTEPHAGSDVGLSSTKAVPVGDGSFRITGTKIFISFGDNDLVKNIVHLVLARTPDAPPGTKGISLFLVPKFLPDADGNPAEPNDVSCVSIEEKMGIHSSPTCVMSFGDDDGAIGWLIGEENQGMRAMFTMMNAARLAVAVQATGIADAGYQKAVDYASERTQGSEIGGDTPGPVPIVVHPDVRRMLLEMKSSIEAMRNLSVHTASCLDLSKVSEGEESDRHRESVELLTPVAKSWCSDTGLRVNSLAVQVYGGMGYIEESGVSQHFRDQRITAIYEGTNGIQAMDLVGRKIGLRMGGAFADLMAEMRGVLVELGKVEELSDTERELEAALDRLQDTTDWIMENGLADPRDALAGATPYLEMFGLTAGGWTMARQAVAAVDQLDEEGADTAYLQAKVTTARFFCEQLLPKVHSLAAAVTAGHQILFDIDVEALPSV
ncbi:MAG: acyl-CoA dehydrogenase [Actinomycetia bacterium]|nr:acyl-CoA dehydrogenase [Actinomycetes bacterium]